MGASNKSTISAVRRAMRFVLLAGLLVAGVLAWRHHRQVNRYSQTIAQINDGHYAAAAEELERFLPEASGEIAAQAKRDLALCYRELGDNPLLSLVRSAELFRKAHAFDPDCLTEQQMQIMGVNAP